MRNEKVEEEIQRQQGIKVARYKGKQELRIKEPQTINHKP
jgi:hypothetical protein